MGMNEYVSQFQREYAEKLNREEYAKELKQMRMVRCLSVPFSFTSVAGFGI